MGDRGHPITCFSESTLGKSSAVLFEQCVCCDSNHVRVCRDHHDTIPLFHSHAKKSAVATDFSLTTTFHADSEKPTAASLHLATSSPTKAEQITLGNKNAFRAFAQDWSDFDALTPSSQAVAIASDDDEEAQPSILAVEDFFPILSFGHAEDTAQTDDNDDDDPAPLTTIAAADLLVEDFDNIFYHYDEWEEDELNGRMANPLYESWLEFNQSWTIDRITRGHVPRPFLNWTEFVMLSVRNGPRLKYEWRTARNFSGRVTQPLPRPWVWPFRFVETRCSAVPLGMLKKTWRILARLRDKATRTIEEAQPCKYFSFPALGVEPIVDEEEHAPQEETPNLTPSRSPSENDVEKRDSKVSTSDVNENIMKCGDLAQEKANSRSTLVTSKEAATIDNGCRTKSDAPSKLEKTSANADRRGQIKTKEAMIEGTKKLPPAATTMTTAKIQPGTDAPKEIGSAKNTTQATVKEPYFHPRHVLYEKALNEAMSEVMPGYGTRKAEDIQRTSSSRERKQTLVCVIGRWISSACTSSKDSPSSLQAPGVVRQEPLLRSFVPDLAEAMQESFSDQVPPMYRRCYTHSVPLPKSQDLSTVKQINFLVGNDEMQHRRYPCDFRRILDIFNLSQPRNEPGKTISMVYIRVNPHLYENDAYELKEGLNLIYLNYFIVEEETEHLWQKLEVFTQELTEAQQSHAFPLRDCILDVIY
ncbi:hypothetical protein HDU96_010437 [Phlyctochytrium bullatum]|nr:hypothetical protein HDU96_010437 [Phlyctochytrium bullatum]